jgi:hypothetical protein
MDIRVVPTNLQAAGSRLSTTGTEVSGVAGGLGGAASSVPGACGFPIAAGAFEAMWVTWQRALVRSGRSVGATGSAAVAAGALYAFVDATTMTGFRE